MLVTIIMSVKSKECLRGESIDVLLMGPVLCWCVNFALSAPPPQPGSARPASPPSDSDPGFVIKNVPSFAEPQPSLGWPQSPPTPQPSPRNVLLSRKNQNSKVFHIEVLNFDINAVMNKHYSEKVPTSLFYLLL